MEVSDVNESSRPLTEIRALKITRSLLVQFVKQLIGDSFKYKFLLETIEIGSIL